jgi:sugar (pentulose or hexulose) kinase
MTKYLLGIDAGTSVIKAAVFSETGTEMSRGAGTVPIINPSPNEAEEDMHRVWSAAATAIREAIVGSSVRPSEIVAVSVTGQGDGSWLIDENGKPKGNAILWTDGRTGKIIDQWYEDGTISKQFKTSGLGPYAGTASAVLRWRKDNQPENLEGATQLWAKDWIAYNLTDDISTDGSDASLAGIDVRTRQWDDSVLETFGIKDIKHVLPPIKESTDLAGEVTAKAAGQTGLKAGTPVFKGQMDITASSLGVGVAEPGDCMAVIGTAGIVTVCTDSLDGGLDPQDSGWVIPHSPDTWIRAMGMNFCTPNVDWFLDGPGNSIRDEAAAKDINSWEYVDDVLASVPVGSRGLIYHGYLAPGGERAPFVKPSARVSFTGIRGYHTPHDMLRAVYEGVAYGIRDCLDSIPVEVKTVRMAGGGANSEVWCQIFADVLGRRIVVPAGSEFGAKGAAIVAGVGAGVFASHKDGVERTVTIVREYEPNLDKTAVYDRYFELYRRTREALQPLWNDLADASELTV